MPKTATPAAETDVQAADLDWYPAERRYSAEASDLGFPAGGAPETFVLVSRAGYRCPMQADHLEVIEGDLQWIDYVAVDPRDSRAFRGVRIFND